MRKLIWFLGVLILLIGCKHQQVIQYVDREVILTETLRDTLLITKMDSSYVRAWLECDSSNQVVIRQLETMQGRDVAQSVIFRDVEKLKYIEVKAKVDSNAVYFALKDRFQSNSNIEYIEVVKEKKVYPRFLVVFAVIGLLSIIYIAYKIYRWIKKKFIPVSL